MAMYCWLREASGSLEPCAERIGMHGVRREARYDIPGAAGKHSKEVLGLPAYLRLKGQRDSSMLGVRRDSPKTL
jgi:hypothetical protein